MLYLKNIETPQPIFIPKDEDTGAVPSGKGVLQSKSWEITENGATIVSPDPGYDGISGGSITVYVSGGGGGETEFKHLTATENGEYPATGNTAFSGVTVDVQPNNQSKTALFTQNGTQVITFDSGYSGLEQVEVVVNLPSDIVNQTKNVLITGNTAMTLTYDQGYTGLESVGIIVNVPDNKQSKSLNITANTATTITYDQGYTGLEQVSVSVDVPDPEQTALTATTNGDYAPSGYYGYSAVTVSVPDPEMTALTATTNGNYTPSGYYGYSAVTVATPEIHNQDKSVTISEDMGQGTNFISASTIVTADTGYTGLGEVQVDVAIPCSNSQYMGTLTENRTYYIGDNRNLWRQMVIDVQVPTGGSLTAITATTNGNYTPQTGYDGFSAVTVDVQPVVTGLTATTNGTYNVPSGIDGYNTVKVQVPSSCPTTAVTVGLGITELPVPATSVTCYGAATHITSWDQLSGETGITMDKWMMLDFEGNEWDNDVYPHYFQRDKCPNAVEFVQQIPRARKLTGFQGNNGHLRKMYLYDVGALETFDSIDIISFSQLVGRNTQEVVISDYGFTSTYGDVQADFSSAFKLAPSITSVTITQKFGDGFFYNAFEGCSALTYVNLGYSVGCAVASDCIGIFSGCTSLETIEGFRGAIEYATIDNSTNPFYNLPALVNFEGFEYLGAEFYRDPTGTHTVDLSISTGLSHTSLINLLNRLATVDSSVTNAQLILGPTNLAKLTASEQAIAINKNWALS